MNKYLIIFFVCLSFIGLASFTQKATLSKQTPQELATLNNKSKVSSKIISVHSFFDIYPELNKSSRNTLIIFDIDDVLITYNDMALRPCGAHFRPTSWNGIDPKEIPYLFSIMLSESEIILVDPLALQFVKELENKKIKTIALTAARTGRFGIIENAEDWRISILEKFGFNFSSSFPQKPIIHFDNETINYSLFKNGILFLGNEKNTKGDLLVKFLTKVQWKPEKIIFIDDKMSNLTSVKLALKKEKISFQGYHYKGVENLPGELKEQIAEVQFSWLRKNYKWLSDAEAKKAEKCLPLLYQ